MRQPASLTLWTYLELLDADRIQSLLDRSARYEAAALTATASWNGKEFGRLDSEFRSSLRKHPDPHIQEQAQLDAKANAQKLIASLSNGGKGPRRVGP